MDTSLSIKEIEKPKDALNYDYLKEHALETIQKLSGKVWTDYNIHDPGITMLEILCYAVTELGYRSQYDIKDLLAKENSLAPKEKDTLFPASQIIPSRPLTIRDYKKILLDIDGVKNATISPSSKNRDFNGVYDIFVELAPENEQYIRNFKKDIFRELNINRNLCEDFGHIKFVDYEPVAFKIDIEVSGLANLKELKTIIYREIINYISPSINFYGLNEMLDKGFTVNEIFNGPLLKNGFIINSDLDKFEINNEILVSDLIKAIMELPGVSYIKNLQIVNTDSQVYRIKEGTAFSFDEKNTVIRLYNNNELIRQDESDEPKNINLTNSQKSKHKRLDFIKEEGIYRQLFQYFSIQNDFPEVYGIGELGLPNSATDLRKSQAKQLKAYLLFFEQVLANYFAQLENLNQLFSIQQIKNTYFTQPLFDIPGIEYLHKEFINGCMERRINIYDSKIIKEEWKLFKAQRASEELNALAQINETEETFLDRRNRLLDHFLSRFSFNYAQYDYLDTSIENPRLKTIDRKIEFLTDISKLTQFKGTAFQNVKDLQHDNDNISGLEFCLNKLIGLKNSSRTYPKDYLKKRFEVERTELGKLESSSNTDIFEILISDYNDKKVLDKVFLYGSSFKNYLIENEGDLFTVKIVFDNATIAKFNTVYSSFEAAESKINELIHYIDEVSERSKSIHIIENIMLRPAAEMQVYGFALYDRDGEFIFRTDKFCTFDERKTVVREILSSGTDKSNYYVDEKDVLQYRIILMDKDNNPVIKSVKYYNSFEDRNEIIDNFTKYFRELSEDRELLDKVLKNYTKYQDIYDISEDPFSFILTILIPSWVNVFQNSRYKAYIENIITKELPAHVFADIIWINMRDLNEVIELYEKLISERRRRILNVDVIEGIIDRLFQLFTEADENY